MIVRELFEKREREELSFYAMLSAKSQGRKEKEKECDVRTCFQRDRDRIIHSKAFKQLKYKTQVLLFPEVEQICTRLIHTIEVSQIARTIAKALRLNEDLTEAIALGHDLGHSPFGHIGESALNEVSPSGFRHHEQSLRVVEVLEKNGQGLNLTYEVRDGILKHTRGSSSLYIEPEELRPVTLEGTIVRLADSITYINHDIEDTIQARMIKMSDLPHECLKILGRRHSERINTMVYDVIINSKDKNFISMSDEVLKTTDQLRSYLYQEVYTHPRIKTQGIKAERVIKELYFYFLENPKTVLEEFSYIMNQHEKERLICDYLSILSDREVISLYKKIFLPESWKLKQY
ncbi:deoxyguanosinetriphosphate triphosphohydrolase [bacterium]|nr:deoxyguanosinetriphosphate triphosphohydrolase [bacterium]MBU1152896.1 deoxyguanosinetriphosphate triphosphohydrolase [bacterium]MBU2599825.1 deoxyguanosinetriphosphate triphosphohydrolase [bacterium]